MEPKVQEQIRLLSLFHYILGAITALSSLIPLIHVGMGVAMVRGVFPPVDSSPAGEPFPAFMGWIFIAVGVVIITLGLLLATGMLIAGARLARRKNRVFCLVIAGIECLIMPLGTILGVFTLIVLTKEEAKAAFGEAAASPPSPPPAPPV